MEEHQDLWHRLGWRRATALSIHFFPTLHPTTIPCLTYSEGGEQIYMFATGECGPYAWPDRGASFPEGRGIPDRALVVAFTDVGVFSRHTDWPNSVDAQYMLSLT